MTLARPKFPKPTCRVKLICGPPAGGKSTYVRAHAQETDIVIDFDLLARERGFRRRWSSEAVPALLSERNHRLSLLSEEPPDRTAWVIVCAPSKELREWWMEALGVRPGDLVLCTADRRDLIERVLNDPDRLHVRSHHIELIDKWLEQEASVSTRLSA